jgi:hypothetical protein
MLDSFSLRNQDWFMGRIDIYFRGRMSKKLNLNVDMAGAV